ncbi:MAG: aquaporin [Gemmatimonadota bacterium]
MTAAGTPVRSHWPEYAAEALGLGIFMLSACGFAALLFHPRSPVVAALPGLMLRSVCMGLAMGLTAVLNVYSPWGRRSGAHLNPAFTLAFYRLGKVARRDLAGYIGGQFVGALAGTGLAVFLLRGWLADPAVNFVATVPGPRGVEVAFLAELVISFLLMLVVLAVMSRPKLARYTGLFAGALVALYITFEAPLSGMSMNPARTIGSAVYAHLWTAVWLYFLAPPLGMLLAVESMRGARAVREQMCAKLHHDDRVRCIFCEHRRG